MDGSNHSKLPEIARLTLLGSAFVGVGTVLNSYVPAFHAPVSWVERMLTHGGQQLARFPLTRGLFAGNPLTTNKTMTTFFAVNIVETMLVGVVIVGAGTAIKLARLKPQDIERWIGGKGRA